MLNRESFAYKIHELSSHHPCNIIISIVVISANLCTVALIPLLKENDLVNFQVRILLSECRMNFCKFLQMKNEKFETMLENCQKLVSSTILGDVFTFYVLMNIAYRKQPGLDVSNTVNQ